ncbi:MAG: phosphatase PAP2 family protein [Solirubrobacteraceae bacterium]
MSVQEPPSPDGGLIAEATRIDLAVYGAVADTTTPRLDLLMRRLSNAADYSRLSILSATLLAALGGRRGRQAAVWGLGSVAVTATVVNLILKPVGRRERPDRSEHRVPTARHVQMPASRSLPSGHTAAAVAFASGASRALPLAGLPLRVLAALVGYSRVHTGAHYPGDVIAGAVVGGVLADLTTSRLARKDPAM